MDEDCYCEPQTAVEEYYERLDAIARNRRGMASEKHVEYDDYLKHHRWISRDGTPWWEMTGFEIMGEIMLDHYLPVIREQLNSPSIFSFFHAAKETA